MEATQHFLQTLSRVVSGVPVFTTGGSESAPHDELRTVENDISLLYRRYEALTEAIKAKIEQEWAEFGVYLENANTVHFITRELFHRIAARLREAEAGVPHFVGPALTPEQGIEKLARPRRLAVVGGTLVAAAAGVFLLLAPEPGPAPTRPLATAAPTSPLPLSADDYATCEPVAESVGRPAPAVATPMRRKASRLQFLSGTDSVILKRKDKPDLMVTVTELPEKRSARSARKPRKAQRIHSLDTNEVKGYTVEIGADDVRVNVEFGE